MHTRCNRDANGDSGHRRSSNHSSADDAVARNCRQTQQLARRPARTYARSGFWVTCSRRAKITDAHYLSNPKGLSRGKGILPKRKTSSTPLFHIQDLTSVISRCRSELKD